MRQLRILFFTTVFVLYAGNAFSTEEYSTNPADKTQNDFNTESMTAEKDLLEGTGSETMALPEVLQEPEIAVTVDEIAVQHWEQDVAQAIGASLYHAADWPVALQYFQSADPQSHDGIFHYMLANTYLNLGFLKEAEESVGAAVQYSPNDADVLFLCGNIYMDAMRYEEASDCFRKGLKSVPENRDAQLAYVRVLMAQGSYDEVIGILEKIYAQSPSNEILQRLATAYEKNGNLEKAEYYFIENKKSHRNEQMGAYALMQFYQRTGQTEKAADVEKAIRKKEQERLGSRNLRALHPSWK